VVVLTDDVDGLVVFVIELVDLDVYVDVGVAAPGGVSNGPSII
jgi:hypothetical protein